MWKTFFQLLSLLSLACSFSSCSPILSPNNLAEMGDDFWIEDAQGKICVWKELVITPETVVYYYPGCGITRVVRPKIRILPAPQMP